ncbi:uncharacterized protein PHACADRAFT_261585 [Phanerochaete carnosa HHB-10118-sp]|uniref:ferric-chelate reductase (NADPH) n=1 Tax=Phanerochaete carnosa (strain HHB-10118-sp) TaxID=650164 RepID=K5W1Z2_PHACS|nr:uncharacterized protein PHACADRAFT_261585 [Phanerochaete carnosa HHB-10118-sp]EKM52899.1 hypothetical protein PHACADRAFT_261585 [Phanerochaete carnosa HHB-10118-sp]
MSDFGAPPVIPTQFQEYNSYVEDPEWQNRFSVIWSVAVVVAAIASAPRLWRSLKTGNAYKGLFGVREYSSVHESYSAVAPSPDRAALPSKRRKRVFVLAESLLSALRWTLPGVELDFGQMLVIVGYLTSVLLCLTINSQLISNPNRGGFLVLAQFPVVFLFATKNNVLSILLGPGAGWEKLNYVHRWSGRGMFICALVHGSLWIRNHLQYGLPILGQQKETSGVAAFGVLCGLVLTSLRPVRRLFYQFFFVVHVLGYVAFFITICYHTIYAPPWIFPPLAFYGLDMLMRMFRYSIKDATLVPVDNNMTLIHIHDCDAGWQAGQHVRLRVFFNGRLFEAHPLTIANAPPSTSALGSRSLTLAARVRGDWTRALNAYAQEEQHRLSLGSEKQLDSKASQSVGVPVQVMFDGAYGGCGIDLGDYESVLLVAGGSGATVTLGVLDDIVGRCARLGRPRGERTRRIEFVWCVRSFGCVAWFADALRDLALACERTGGALDLHVSVYVTCLCNPEAVPDVPNCDVSVFRPSVGRVLRALVTPPDDSELARTASCEKKDADADSNSDADSEVTQEHCLAGKLNWVGLGGGVGVVASGPESLICETQNAVARLGITQGTKLGGIGLHTELFAL